MVVRPVMRDQMVEILCFEVRVYFLFLFFPRGVRGVAMSGFAIICYDISKVFLVCSY